MDQRPAKVSVYFLYFVCLGILIGLGSWQLTRGLKKRDLELTVSAGSGGEIGVIDKESDWPQFSYRNVILSGYWLGDRRIFLDNRVNRGVPGHELLVPLALKKDGTAVLVNFGWFGGDEAPAIELSADREINVKGRLYLPQKGFTLGPAYTDSSSWPVTIQYFDPEQIEKALRRKVSPAVLVIDTGDARALPRIWKPYVMDAKKHYGYAMQWWGLALVLLIFGFIWRKNDGRKK